MLGPIVIDNIRPRTTTGDHPAKATVGIPARVSADIFRDGHDLLAARVRWGPAGASPEHEVALRPTGNDEWEATFVPDAVGLHVLVVEAWTDRVGTWRHDVAVKRDAGHDVSLELEEGARLYEASTASVPAPDRALVERVVSAMRDTAMGEAARVAAGLDPAVGRLLAAVADPTDLTAAAPRPLWVDRRRAQVGAWYELFPRSEGGLKGTIERLPAVAAMGFDVLYLPPIHPIGRAHRKGRGNTLHASADDVGSPWAIGSPEGGHTAIHPDLGTLDDFRLLVTEAGRAGMEVALDYALQCSPDHPWVAQHPEWFHHRPDGSIKHAENPPKRYEDIYPLNFWPADDADRRALWDACRAILEHWIAQNVRIFRVDNPHTKPLAFWEWLIPALRAEHPDVVLLAEAFTSPKMMAKLAEIGFTQSYTYFTWRTSGDELRRYLEELSSPPLVDFMRPSFWPTTPDILAGPLRGGAPSAFAMRLVLAATMVPSYGMYSGYELGENEPASDANEEYRASEKYEVKRREWDHPDSLAPLVTRLNDIRRRHPCFDQLDNICFHHADNPAILAYSKHTDDRRDVVLVVVNLDPHGIQDDMLGLDLDALGIPSDRPFEAHDELTGAAWVWEGRSAFVRLDPAVAPAHLLHLRRLGPVAD